MTPASAIILAAAKEPCAPWPRHVLLQNEWAQMSAALASEPTLALLALWADTTQAHALLFDASTGGPLLASTVVEAGCYPALSPARPIAAWFERMMHDLWGHVATGGTDQRPWLDHGHWSHTAPMALRPGPQSSSSEPPEFLPVDNDDLDQMPLGPVHGGIQAATHMRLIGRGESIERVEARLGYTHKGTLTLMRGKSPRAAARFAARLSGEATVAHAIAFAQATEAALQIEIPARAAAWRGVMAELERISGHLGDLGAVADAAGFGMVSSRCLWHCEAIHRAASLAFGHRLMMDCVVPGGVAADITPDGPAAIGHTLTELGIELPDLERLHHAASFVGHLSGTGVVSLEMAMRFAAGGVIGRAAGRDVDLRRVPGYAPYGTLTLSVPLLYTGDAEARGRIRLAEIAESIRLLRRLLDTLPEGAISVPLPTESGEGIGYAEGVRGDIWHWLRLDHGQIASVFMRDPCWAHWPLLEAVLAGSQSDDLPVIQASFGLATSGVDL
jgi:Ni,Fe-hydrogenase III large subunit